MNIPEEPREQPTDGTAPENTVPEGTGPDAPEARETTAVYTRRRGAPTLTTWILLSLAVPAVGALVIATLLGVSGLTALLTVTLAAVLAIGFPLAGLAALVDAIIQRRRRRG